MKIKVTRDESVALMQIIYTSGKNDFEQFLEYYPGIQAHELPYIDKEKDDFIFPSSKHYIDLLEDVVKSLVACMGPVKELSPAQNENQRELVQEILKKIDAEIDDITREKLAERKVNLAVYI